MYLVNGMMNLLQSRFGAPKFTILRLKQSKIKILFTVAMKNFKGK